MDVMRAPTMEHTWIDTGAQRALASSVICQAVRDVAWHLQGGREIIERMMKHQRFNRRREGRVLAREIDVAMRFLDGADPWCHYCDVLGLDAKRSSEAAWEFVAGCVNSGVRVGVEFQRVASRIGVDL